MRWLSSGRCIPVLWIVTIGILMTTVMSGCASIQRTSHYSPPMRSVVDSTSVTYFWTPPPDGTPVDYYEMKSSSGQEWTATRAKKRITVPADSPHRVRVRGVDAQGHEGPWSLQSKEWPSIDGRDDSDIDNPIRRERP